MKTDWDISYRNFGNLKNVIHNKKQSKIAKTYIPLHVIQLWSRMSII